MRKYQAVQSMSAMGAKLQNEKKNCSTFFFQCGKMFTRFAVAKIDNQVFFSSPPRSHESLSFVRSWDQSSVLLSGIESWVCVCLLNADDRMHHHLTIHTLYTVSRALLPTNPSVSIMKKAFFNYLIAHNYFMEQDQYGSGNERLPWKCPFCSPRGDTQSKFERENTDRITETAERRSELNVGGEISFLMIVVKWHERIWANIIILKLFSSLLSNTIRELSSKKMCTIKTYFMTSITTLLSYVDIFVYVRPAEWIFPKRFHIFRV